MSNLSAVLSTSELRPGGTELSLLCWKCATILIAGNLSEYRESASLRCLRCGTTTVCREGIWRCLSPEQTLLYERFIREYESIRASEGRGSVDPDYYLKLPFKDLSGANTGQWKIRARTFLYLERRLLAPRAAREGQPLQILDLGAGNGWLSYQLALLGHVPVAVDLLTNCEDGLGASAHFRRSLPSLFPRVQASLDTLPFSPSTFDLAIFNASFHYSQDFALTLREALRCIRPGGAVIIMDTPWYAREQSGDQMVAEKRDFFQHKYGFASNSIASLEFLTPSRIRHLEVALDIKFQTHRPFYGFEWLLRPVLAWLRRRRTPSQFRVFVVEVPA
jgi:SAM-dependent methyltransferase